MSISRVMSKRTAIRATFVVAVLAALSAAGYTLAASTVPAPTFTATPLNPTNSTSATFSFTGAASGAKYECKLDAAAFATCTGPKSYSSLAAGSHNFQVRVVDKNKTSDPASYTWTVDLTAPPAPSITAKPSNPSDLTAPSFSFTDSESGVSFLCKLDAAAYAACSSPKAYSSLALGSHTFSVQAKDAAGNVGASTSYTWSIVPPTPTITAKPANPTSQTSASFSFSDTLAGVTYVCALDTPTFTACSSPQNYAGPLTQASHTFQVKAVSGANQSSPASYTWTVDTSAPPTPAITAKPASLSNTTSPSFSFSDSEAGVTFLCKLDAGGYVVCTSPTGYSGLAQGAHSFSVEAKDAAGNISGPVTWAWTIDSIAPPAPVLTDKPDDPNGDGIADFTWTEAETGVTFRCSIENGPFAGCTSPVHYIVNVANDGQHQFAVSATDAAGNASTTFYSWKVLKGINITLTGDAVGLLAPGLTQPIALTVHNPNNFPVTVTGVQVTASTTTAGCTADDNVALTQTDITPAQPLLLPSNGTVTLPAQGHPAPQIFFKNTLFNQDACKGGSFGLAYTGTGVKS
jgi:hypothetical protein